MPPPTQRLLSEAFSWPFACYLVSCEERFLHPDDRYRWLVGWGDSSLQSLEDMALPEGWQFGLLPYSLFQVLEPTVVSRHRAGFDWPETAFFRAKGMQGETRTGEALTWGNTPAAWNGARETGPEPRYAPFRGLAEKEAYLRAVRQIQMAIGEGAVYEVNLSQPFAAEDIRVEPFRLTAALWEASPVPMAALFKWGDLWVFSASPERFLRLQDGILVSQPVKGTTARRKQAATDRKAAEALQTAEKERAENVMIVDLVRNDLNRVCLPGSVIVERLWEVQSYARLHHLVSTVRGELQPGTTLPQILQATFPPGSMTGAPKVAALKQIDRWEWAARGAYSGALGYRDPAGNFDFNVVIRSLVYDAVRQRAHYNVGGAVTYDSDPEAEYAETLLKAEALEAAWYRLGRRL